jgi:transposase
LRFFLSTLNDEQRRLYAAIESRRLGRGGCRSVSEITGLCLATVYRGRSELAALLAGTALEETKGRAGRPSIEEKYPEIKTVLEELVSDNIAGDPMNSKKWVRISSRRLSKKLAGMGYKVNYHTVCRLLKDMGYSMKVNVKKRASTTHSPKRDAQFDYIAAQKAAFLTAGNPVISVDAKKKELIGNFKADGKSWCKSAIEVNAYTYGSLAECVATPYGVYDVRTNKGYIWVGTSGKGRRNH